MQQRWNPSNGSSKLNAPSDIWELDVFLSTIQL